MLRNRVAYAIVLLSSAMLMYYTGDQVASIFLYSLLLLPVISALLLLVTLPFLKIDIEVQNTHIAKGDTLELSIFLRNRGPLYLPFMAFEFYQNQVAFRKPFKLVPVSLAPGSDTTLYTEAECLYAGRFQVGVSRIIVSDLCGLVLIPIRRPAVTVYVSPDIYSLTIPPGLTGAVNIESLSQRETREEGSEFYSVREYQWGDPLKMVHWGLTAKMDELQVRLMRRTPDPTCLIMIDPSLVSDIPVETIPINDGSLCCAISLASAFLTEKIPAKLLFYDGTPRSEELGSITDLSKGKTYLAESDFVKDFSLNDLTVHFWNDLKAAHSIVVIIPEGNEHIIGTQLYSLAQLGKKIVVCQIALPDDELMGTELALEQAGIGVCRFIAGVDTGKLIVLSGGEVA